MQVDHTETVNMFDAVKVGVHVNLHERRSSTDDFNYDGVYEVVNITGVNGERAVKLKKQAYRAYTDDVEWVYENNTDKTITLATEDDVRENPQASQEEILMLIDKEASEIQRRYDRDMEEIQAVRKRHMRINAA